MHFFFRLSCRFFSFSLTSFVCEAAIQNKINEMSQWLRWWGAHARITKKNQKKKSIQTKKKKNSKQKKTRWAFVSTFWQVLRIIFHSFYRWDHDYEHHQCASRALGIFGLFRRFTWRARKFLTFLSAGWAKEKVAFTFWCGSSSMQLPKKKHTSNRTKNIIDIASLFNWIAIKRKQPLNSIKTMIFRWWLLMDFFCSSCLRSTTYTN